MSTQIESEIKRTRKKWRQVNGLMTKLLYAACKNTRPVERDWYLKEISKFFESTYKHFIGG